MLPLFRLFSVQHLSVSSIQPLHPLSRFILTRICSISLSFSPLPWGRGCCLLSFTLGSGTHKNRTIRSDNPEETASLIDFVMRVLRQCVLYHLSAVIMLGEFVEYIRRRPAVCNCDFYCRVFHHFLPPSPLHPGGLGFFQIYI